MRRACDDRTFIELFESVGAEKTARFLKVTVRSVFKRRNNLQIKLGQSILCPEGNRKHRSIEYSLSHPDWIPEEISDGVILVGSDAHYWPGIVTDAHKGFVKFCRELKPKIVVMNGDVLDGATVSRHMPIGWEKRPSLIQELEAVQERLGEIEKAAGKAKRYWTLGNHDQRFETRLATVAHEYAKIHGVHLKDHFPLWEACWSLCVNDDVVIKHRMKGGIHATHNNTLWAGRTMVTGHLHSLKSTPFSDYNGTRWGVDTGTLAEPYGPQFRDYTEQSPSNWRSGFAVLTFHKGKLLQPQLALVIGKGKLDYCGKVYDV